MMKAVDKSRKGTRAAIRAKIQSMDERLQRATASLKMSDKSRRRLLALLGYAGIVGRIPASDLQARTYAAFIFCDLMAHEFKVAPAGRRYFWCTFTTDVGITVDRSPVINRDALHGMIDKALRQLDLSGVAVLETQAIINYPRRGLGRALQGHGHAIAWTDDARFNAKTATARLNDSRAWRSVMGNSPVQIVEVTHTAGDMRWLAHYMLKPPHEGKNLMESKRRPGRALLMQTTEGYRPELALRVMEGLSHVELFDLIFGVGKEGAAIVTQLRRAVRKKLKALRRGRPTVPVFNTAKLWAKINRDNRSDKYSPYRFITGAERPIPPPTPTFEAARDEWATVASKPAPRGKTRRRGPFIKPTGTGLYSAGFIDRREEQAKRVRAFIKNSR